MNKKAKPPEIWENTGKNAAFVRIHYSLLESSAFKSLKPRQRTLYLYMKAQYKGKVTKNTPNQQKAQFKFNWALASKHYCLYTNKDTFYKDIKALIEAGFIVCVENNKNLRQCSVYQFSHKWISEQTDHSAVAKTNANGCKNEQEKTV